MGLRAGTRATGSVSAQALGPSAAESTVTTPIDHIANDNTAFVTATITVKDVAGARLAGATPGTPTSTDANAVISAPSASDVDGVSTCTVKSNAGSAGVKTLSFAVGGRAAASTATYTVDSPSAAPVLTSILPVSGTKDGGTTVTGTGTGFQGGMTGTLGGHAITITVVSAATFTFVTPAHTAEAALHLVVTNTDAQTSELADAFEYVNVPAPLFYSDWSTATGATDAALRDTGKVVPWPHLGNESGILSVVASTGLGFPAGMTNVMRVQLGPGTVGGAAVSIVPADAIIPTGTTYYRFYLLNAVSDAEGDKSSAINSVHYIESNTGSPQPWTWCLASKNDGTFPLQFQSIATGAGSFLLGGKSYGSPIWTDFFLTKNSPYRIEWALTRTAADTHTLDIRIYNAAGALVYDKDNIYKAQAETTLATAGVDLPLTDATLGGFYLGSNGGQPPWTPMTNVQYIYYGGVMVRTDDWCGAY
jgi:hypothetical protein